MLKERRHASILHILQESNDATIKELSDSLGVSDSTVRRDLRMLSDGGLVKLTHGGAVLSEGYFSAFELDSRLAAETEKDAKASIGAYAAAQVIAGQTVIFDSSTTVLAATRALVRRKLELTAVTNSLEIAEVLSSCSAISVMVVGGSIRKGSPTLFGNPGLGFLSELHADLVLLGTHSMSEGLLTETSQDIVAMKRAMLLAGRKKILLADKTKFRPPALFTICGIEDVDEVVTNADAPKELISMLREAEVVVRTV